MYINGKGTAENTYDAIVIGSSISGGWVAKELCQKGLKALMLECEPEASLLYVQLIKNLTLSGFFPLEIGMKQARKYLTLSRKFQALIPNNKGTKVWAT